MGVLYVVRFCDQCGSELKENAIFCSKCGAKSDLPPETSVKNESSNNGESTQEKVNDLANDKTESVGDKVNENTETIGTKIDKLIDNTNTGNNIGGFNLNDINWSLVLKYSIASAAMSLILGVILMYAFLGTVSMPRLYNTDVGLMPYSFYIPLIIVVSILSAHIKNKVNSIVMGAISGLITGIFQSTVISMVYGHDGVVFFSYFIGNQTLGLIIVGVIFAYVGNVYLSDKINFPIINQYLGE